MAKPDALLCEHCGYDLHGFTREDVCPECGRSVRLSLPGGRPGAPWQQRGVIRAQFKTMIALIANSKQAFRTAKSVDDRTSFNQAMNVLLTLLAFALPMLVLGSIHAWAHNQTEYISEIAGAAILSMLYGVLFLGVILIIGFVVLILIAGAMRLRSPADAAAHALIAWTCCWPTATAIMVFGGWATSITPIAIFAIPFALLFVLIMLVTSIFGMRGMRFRNHPHAMQHLKGEPIAPD